MPGGVGAVFTYGAIVAQRHWRTWDCGRLFRRFAAQPVAGEFGRYGVDDVRWLASVGTDYWRRSYRARADSPWKR